MNSAEGDPNGNSRGGGIFTEYGSSENAHKLGGIVTVFQSSISGNSAALGGGIYLEREVVQVSDSIIDNNFASESGGGVYAFQELAWAGPDGIWTKFEITGSRVTDNQAKFGAGIDNAGATVEVANSSFVGNSALENGGAIASRRVSTPTESRGPATTITNTTISGNDAQNAGAGVFHDPRTKPIDSASRVDGSRLRVINTTITLNESGSAGGRNRS